MEHPAVAEAGVIGKPDPVAGEIVKAFVALKAGPRAERGAAPRAARLRPHGGWAPPWRRRRSTFAEHLPHDPQRQDHAPAAQGPRARPARGRPLDAGEAVMTTLAAGPRGAASPRELRAAAAARDAAHPPLRGEVRRALQRQPRSAASCTSTSARRPWPSASCRRSAPRTRVVATYREHGHALARGVPMDAIMAEMFGKADGLQPRPRRLDAPVRRRAPLLRRQRDRRRRAAARGRAWRSPTRCIGRHGSPRASSARRGGRGRVPRVAQPRGALAAAGAVLSARTTSTPWAPPWPARTSQTDLAAQAPRLRHGRRGPWTAWTSWPCEDAAQRAGASRAAAAARASSSCGPTASAPTRCTTPTATATRPRWSAWKAARPDPALDAAVLAERRGDSTTDDRRGDGGARSPPRSTRPSRSPRPAAGAGGGPHPLRVPRAGHVDRTRPAGAARRRHAQTTYREALREAHPRGDARDDRGCSSWARTSAATAAASPSAWACSRSSARSGSATPRCRSRRSSAPASGRRCGGMRPIVEIMTVNFSLLALDQILNNAATLLHMSGGQLAVPLVIRMTTGARPPARRPALAQPRGLVRPHPRAAGAGPGDARGRPRHARGPPSQDPDPVLIFEHGSLYTLTGELPTTPAPVDIDHAPRVRRTGSDVTLIAYGGTLAQGARPPPTCLRRRASTAEVIDLRVLRPLDEPRVLASVAQDPPSRGRRRGLALRQPRRPRSAPGSPSRRSTTSTRRWSGSAAPRCPCPTPGTWSRRPCRSRTTSWPRPGGRWAAMGDFPMPSLGADMERGHRHRVAGLAR